MRPPDQDAAAVPDVSTRKRKGGGDALGGGDAAAEDAGPHIIVQVFDLLYRNGESLLRKPLVAPRRARARAAPVEDKLCFADGIDHAEDGDTAPIEAAPPTRSRGAARG